MWESGYLALIINKGKQNMCLCKCLYKAHHSTDIINNLIYIIVDALALDQKF